MKTGTPISLIESVSSKPNRVDRVNSIIFGVKILGRSSPNTSGARGATGRDYSPRAVSSAVRLYEGRKVNTNHKDRKDPTKDRSVYDRIGRLESVSEVDGELFGNLRLLKSHPMTAAILEAAETMPDAFALSHDANAHGRIVEGRQIIEEIFKVNSVDIVADAATCTSLFESKEPQAMPTLKESLTEIGLVESDMVRLLEMEGMDMDAPVATSSSTADFHLGEAIKHICQDSCLSSEDKLKKIKAILKLQDDGKDVDDMTPAMESLQAENVALKARIGIIELCESLEFKPTKVQMAALSALPEADRKTFIQEMKAAKPSGKAPRSGPPVDLRESKENATPKDASEFSALLMR